MVSSLDKLQKTFGGLNENPSGKEILKEYNQDIQFEIGEDLSKSLTLTDKKGDEFVVVRIRNVDVKVEKGKISWPPPKKPYPTKEYMENTWIKVSRRVLDQLLGYGDPISPTDAYYQHHLYVTGMQPRPQIVSWIFRMFLKIQDLRLALR